MSEIKKQTLYRSYRPTEFAEVVGQDHVTSVLKGALEKKDIGHAYMFIGTRGIGKTTIARLYTKALGCAPEDVYEIDGASNRKIDDIRAIREAVHVMPFSSPYKVYIIDEVHMLTKEAFNALLKTLEEPPAHVIFMMATTEPEKIPDTIMSRCQVFQLHRPGIASIRTNLERVAKGEELTIEPAAAELIALFADGSFRDSLGVLQKVITASADKHLSLGEVEKTLGTPSSASVVNFVKAAAEKDLGTMLETLSQIDRDALDVRLFVVRVAAFVRTVLRARFAPSYRAQAQKDLGDAWSHYEPLLNADGKEVNAGFLAMLLGVQGQMHGAASPLAQLEVALMVWAQ